MGLVQHAIVSKLEGVLGFAFLKKDTHSVDGCNARTVQQDAVNVKSYKASVNKKYFTEKTAHLPVFSVGKDGVVNIDFENGR